MRFRWRAGKQLTCSEMDWFKRARAKGKNVENPPPACPKPWLTSANYAGKSLIWSHQKRQAPPSYIVWATATQQASLKYAAHRQVHQLFFA